jgi:hypothetical protein
LKSEADAEQHWSDVQSRNGVVRVYTDAQLMEGNQKPGHFDSAVRRYPATYSVNKKLRCGEMEIYILRCMARSSQ